MGSAIAAIATAALFASAWADVLVAWPLLLGIRLLLVGLGLLFVAGALHPGEATHLARTIRPLAPLALIPAAWLLIQAVPLPFALSNPVWSSAAGALSAAPWGHITVDVGQTVYGLLGIGLAAALTLLVASLTIDRTRAEGALITLTGASVLLPAVSAAMQWLDPHGTAAGLPAAIDSLILAALLALGCGYLLFERHETRHAGRARAVARLFLVESLCLGLALVCLAVAVALGGTVMLVAAAAGFLVFVSIILSRRIGLGPWLVIASLIVAGVAFVSFEANGFGTATTVLGGASGSNDIERRMLQDVPWAGTGGGTAAAISTLYRSLEDIEPFVSSTTAVKLRVELGTTALCLVVLLFSGLEFVLVRNALQRGRDSIYAVVGAAFIPPLLILGFSNAGLFDWGVISVICGVIGLALCQSQGRIVAR